MASVAKPKIYVPGQDIPALPGGSHPGNRKKTTHLFIHHSASTGLYDDVYDFHSWHLKRGFSMVGYAFVIPKKTRLLDTVLTAPIEQGRPMNATGAHCLNGYNSVSPGICLSGNFETETPTTEQIDSLVKLLGWLCSYYNLPVSKIVGHRDGQSTSCPGKNLYAMLPSIRTRVAGLLSGTSEPTPAPETDLPAEVVKARKFVEEYGLITEKNWGGVVSRGTLAIILSRMADKGLLNVPPK